MLISEYMRVPTSDEWYSELADGWRGPDGSTASTDTIMGVRIGRTTKDYRDVKLPASLHDYRYRLGRERVLSSTHRHAADVGYRDECIDFVKRELDNWFLVRIGVARAQFRYYILRMFGWKSFRDS